MEFLMRKWHRWLSIVVGVFLLWIAATGVLSQVGSLVNDSARKPAASPAAAAPPGFVCPPTMTCRPKPQPGGWNVGLLHHLHSGEQFGPIGVAISLLSGLALLFFAFSGLWMYWQMFTARSAKSHSRGGRFFW
jgi:uncharacterized iron-regulated membrane protein